MKFYYPTYRKTITTYFRIKSGTVGHIINKDLELLCKEKIAQKESFNSYVVTNYAKPGYKLCEECKALDPSRSRPTTRREKDLDKLKRWNDAISN